MKEKIETLIGREFEVEQTKDGKYIVLYLTFNREPPPKGDTPEEAMENFIKWYGGYPQRVLPDDVPELEEEDLL